MPPTFTILTMLCRRITCDADVSHVILCTRLSRFSAYNTEDGRSLGTRLHVQCTQTLHTVIQLFAPTLPAQLADSKQNCLHCDTTSMELGTLWTTTATHENILLSASQARSLQSAVLVRGALLYSTSHSSIAELELNLN